MKSTTSVFQSRSRKEVFYYKWTPSDTEPKAIVQIAHGMAEHAGRYEHFASFLVKNGYAVFANDHRGHGKTAGSPSKIGYTEEGNFWKKAIGDMYWLGQVAKDEFPEIPHFMLGHSMGSLLLRDYISKHGQEISGAVLSATGGDPGLLGIIGLLIARAEAVIKGRKKQSPFLNALSFGKFNQPFKPNRTEFDWLSRDEEQVDKYVADPMCGTVFTTGFFIDLVQGVNQINAAATFSATPKTLPILLTAGDNDPVGDMGKGVEEVFNKYKKHGCTRATLKLYKNARHEILNETNQTEVYADILNWLESHLPTKV